MVKTNILGTDYEIEVVDLNNPMVDGFDGRCFVYEKRIIVRHPEYMFKEMESDELKQQRFHEVLLHELIHGFSRESGTFYDDNENLVDWFALMIPKIVKAHDEIIDQLKKQEKENESTD